MGELDTNRVPTFASVLLQLSPWWFYMTEHHAGLSLDNQWDLIVDESNGDLAVDRVADEVKKDLALAVGRGLESESIVGFPFDRGTVADIQLYIERIVSSDPRVSSVDDVAVDADPATDTIEISVVASLGTFERFVEIDIDDDNVPEQVVVSVAFENGELVQTDIIGEV